jgi:hypothetical protein
VRAGRRALDLVHDEPVVALGGEDRRHAPGSGLVAVIFQDPADRLVQAAVVAFLRIRRPAPAWTTRAALSG